MYGRDRLQRRDGCKTSSSILRCMYASAQNAELRRNTLQTVGPPETARITAFGGMDVNAVSFHILLENSVMLQLKRFSAFFFAVLLVSVLGCASTSKSEGTGEYVDDSVITTKVKAAIFNEPSLKVAEINVETFKGVVQLSGFVRSQADINKAVHIARGVGGVTSVRNDMRLK
jgi:hypothetical protein